MPAQLPSVDKTPTDSPEGMKRTLASLLIWLTLAASPAFAQDWALNGFDPVSYFSVGRAVPGEPDIATRWRGKSWHFSTEENRLKFESNPRAYAPGFGGFCPVSLAEGKRIPGDPRQFVVIGQRIYLLRSASAARQLMADPRGVLTSARRTWMQMAK